MSRDPHRTRALAAVAAAVLLGGAAPDAASAQRVGAFIRVGSGVDSNGHRAHVGQIELVDSGRSTSVELALSLFQARVIEQYRASDARFTHDYREETQAPGVALMANLLLRHSRDLRGPYAVAGLGLGVLDVDWKLWSATDDDLGLPLPGGGSEASENGPALGSMLNLGLGFRLFRHADVRAQALTVLVPSTVQREDLKFVHALTLSAGLGF